MKYRLAFVLTIVALVAQLFITPVAPVLAASYNVVGASVSADPLGYNFSGGSSGVTNLNGQYVINDSIGVGQYNVTASSVGFLDQAQTVTINSTSDVDTLNFNLARSGILWGRVLDPNGQPVIGAEVSLLDANNNTVDTTTTDSNGQYYFYTDVFTESYQIQVDFQFSFQLEAALLQYESNATGLSIPYQDAPYLANGFVGAISAPVSATAGASTQVPDIVLQSSGVITGTVTGPNGQPMANVPISIEGQNTDTSYLLLTDSSGNYRASYDIYTDTYTVTADLFGYVQTSGTVAATQTGTANLNLQIARSAGLSGHIFRTSDNKPLSGAEIELEGKTTHGFGFAESDSNGFYSIFGSLPTDSYDVNVEVGGLPFYTGTIALTAGVNSTQDFSGNAFFVTGTVQANSTGGPGISDAFISGTFLPLGFGFGGFTASDGTFSIPVCIPEGLAGQAVQIKLTASASGYQDSSAIVNTMIGNDVSQNFVLTPAAAASSASATITGTVTGGSGPNLPQATYWWHSGNFLVGVQSTSDIPFIFTLQSNDSIELYAQGPEGTQGTTTVWLPDSAFRGPFTAVAYPGPNPTLVSQTDNGTYTAVELSYGHSEHLITIMGSTPAPEFPGIFVLAALGSAVAVGLLYERKLRFASPAQIQ